MLDTIKYKLLLCYLVLFKSKNGFGHLVADKYVSKFGAAKLYAVSDKNFYKHLKG